MAVPTSHSTEMTNDESEIVRVLDVLDAADVDAEGHAGDLRRHPMRGQTLCVTMMSADSPRELHVRLRDLSSKGVAFLSGAILLPGTRICLTMPIVGTHASEELRAIVRRTRCVGQRLFEIGADVLA